jgi:hypothetical protein
LAATTLLGLTFLVIGESHMSLPGYLIDPLHDDLTKQGAMVYSVGACGASAGDWLKKGPVPCGAERSGNGKSAFKGRDSTTTPIKELIATDKPDVVVVIIGDTMASYGKPFPQAWAWENITNLTKEIASTKTKCVWVGPPWGNDGGKYGKTENRVQFMSKFLANNVSPCTYIDSLQFSKPKQWATLDGQHFTPAGYQAWSNAITQSIVNLPDIKQAKK